MKRYIRPITNSQAEKQQRSVNKHDQLESERDRKRARIRRFRKERMRKRTAAELKFHAILKELRIDFRSEKILSTGGRYSKKYRLIDFYLRDYNIGVEIDGNYHLTSDQFLKDTDRTEQLKRKKRKYRNEIRFTNDEILAGTKDDVVKKLIVGIVPFAKKYLTGSK